MEIETIMISIKQTQRLSFKLPCRFFKLVSRLISLSLILYNTFDTVHSQIIDVAFNRDICDPHEFYQPYVKVSKTRKGPIVKGLYETGHMVVSEYSGLMCINGPAFIYIDNKTEAQVFSHGCFAFNRRNIKDYQTTQLPPLDENTVIYGYKIYSVFLIADPLDVRRSQFNWFRHPNFGYLPGPDVNIAGSSFGMVLNDGGKSGTDVFEDPPGPTKYCFEIESLAIFGKVSGSIQPGEKPKFCYQAGDEDPSDEFFEVFKKDLKASDYKWIECPDPEPGGITTEIDTSAPDGMPDFRIIDPAMMRPLGSPGKPFRGKTVVKTTVDIPFYSRPYPPGYFFKGEPGYVESATEPSVDANGEVVTEKPLKKVKTELIICEELPELQDPCSEEPDAEKACDLLKHTLTIEEVKWTENELLMAASWRKDIFTLINTIYQKVCPQVSKGLAPAVTRVVEYFILEISKSSKTKAGTGPSSVTGEIKHKILNDPMRPQWKEHLIPDLERCLASAEKMPFYRTRDLVNEKRKTELEQNLEGYTHDPNSTVNLQELEDLMRDVHIQFPYHIWLPPPDAWNNQTQIQIRGHIEAVEVDYNLDWAIDIFWKVFSTVLGYCNKHYYLRNGDTFKSLYSYYTEDILDLLLEQWVQNAPADGTEYIFGNFEKAYDQLFGEFVNGIASRYIDACNDGAYWWADVPDYRPVRPLYLKEGAIPGGSPKPVNFFVEHPLFPSDPEVGKRKR